MVYGSKCFKSLNINKYDSATQSKILLSFLSPDYCLLTPYFTVGNLFPTPVNLNFVHLLITVGIVLTGLLSFPSSLKAALLYDESVNEDLSGNYLSPTKLPDLALGENDLQIVINNTSLNSNTVNKDLDYFTFTLPQNLALTQLILKNYILGDDAAFIAIQKGSVITEDPHSPNPENLLGFAEVGVNPADSVVKIGEDALPLMGLNNNRPNLPNGYPSPNPQGFTAPLPSGNYAFWVQQSSYTEQPTQIVLSFVTTSVPEPSSVVALTSLGLLGTFWKIKKGRV